MRVPTLKESFETAYQDYYASQNSLLRRLHPVTVQEIESRYPEFFVQVCDLIEDPEDFLSTHFVMMRGRYMEQIPYVVLPRGENRVFHWDEGLDKLVQDSNVELTHALDVFGDRERSY